MRKDYNLEKRKYVIGGFLLVIAVIYAVRLFGLQIADSKYKESANSNAFLKKTIYPSRGLIYDRNDNLLVFNQAAYDVMCIPKDIEEFDTIDFCRTLGITKEQFLDRVTTMEKDPNYSAYTPQRIITHLSAENYGSLQEKLYRFPGFYIQKRSVRNYTRNSAANILGTIREASPEDIKRDDYYSPGDYTGDLGVEKSYETELRGIKGQEILIRDARGRIQGRYEDGARDVEPVDGRDIKLSIDIELQEYAEKLMAGKRGAVVAIEPKTGEILCLVTSPGYDPSLLTGNQRGANYRMLSQDPSHPLFDRALMGAYPPGSTFKPTQALILQQEGIVNLSTAYPCSRGYISGRLKVGCHGHASPIALKPALQTSCNAYFCYGLRNMIDNRKKYKTTDQAFEIWKNHLVSMGYGYRLGVDLPGEGRGFIPNSQFYDKFYGHGHWSANTIISIAIGQGEILATPLQIANLCATVANRGWFITPHVVKSVQGSSISTDYKEKNYPTISQDFYQSVAEGMRMAVTGGTCRRAAFGNVEVAGKTGTAQNPHGNDHSAFIGFAPYNDPQIAVCAYVENAGFGATYGVPIGSLVMEKYLTGQITRGGMEENMMHSSIRYVDRKK